MILALVAVAALVAAQKYIPLSVGALTGNTVLSQGPTLQGLQRLSHLVTTRAMVADVLVGEGEGCRGSWLIRGDALLGIDLSRAQVLEKDYEGRRATVRLPTPEVMQARVDHQRSRTWQVRRMVWLPWNADQDRLRDAVMTEAQQLVARAAGSGESIEQAKTAAAAIIVALYAEVGWGVEVIWETATSAQASGETPQASRPPGRF